METYRAHPGVCQRLEHVRHRTEPVRVEPSHVRQVPWFRRASRGAVQHPGFVSKTLRQSNCPYDSPIKRKSPCVWYGALEGDHRERGFRGHACTQNTASY